MARRNEKKARGDGELGERIRRRRKVIGLTAKELARVADVSPSYVSQLEHGKQDQPSLEVLGALAAALGMPASELLGEPSTVETTVAAPPALAFLAGELGLDAATTAMLAGINVDGYQPASHDGWLLVWLAIRHACAGDTRLAVPLLEGQTGRMPVGVGY